MSAFLQRETATIHYHVFASEGQQPLGWLTLVNGYTRSMKDFWSMAQHFSRLGYDVLVLDNRGSGKTEHHGAFTVEDLAADIVGLWDELNIASTSLLGISMGGRICQQVLRAAPERVGKLVLVSTTADATYVMKDSERKWGNDLPAIKATMAKYFAPKFLAGNKLLVEAMAKNIHAAIGKGSFQSGADDQDDALAGIDATPYLADIEVPTLIIHGREDQIIGYKAALHLFDHIAGSELLLLADIGHLLLAECPKRLYGEVERFLKHQ